MSPSFSRKDEKLDRTRDSSENRAWDQFNKTFTRVIYKGSHCFRACLREGGGPQVGVVTCGRSPHLTYKRD